MTARQRLRGACTTAGLPLAFAALTGCMPSPIAPSGPSTPVVSLGERLAREASRIPMLIGPRQLLLTLGYVLAAAVMARLAAVAVHGLWRLGFDRERRLGRWVVFIKLGLGLSVVYGLLHGFVVAAPVLSGAVLVIFGAVAVVTLRSHLENLMVGVVLAFRRRMRPGDRIVVGPNSGTVREIGLTGIHLRMPDGANVYLPARLLNDQAVLVTRAENTAQVVVALHNVGELTTDQLATVRRVALLSPYRSVGSPVRIRHHASGTLEVEVQAQAGRLAADAQAQLDAAVRACLVEK